DWSSDVCSSDLGKVIKKLDVDELIFASHLIAPDKKSLLIDQCLEHDIHVLTLPPINRIMNGGVNVNQIQKVKIEDLLERSQIVISNDCIREQLEGKRILVTGAAGSIGSEIAKQLGKYDPKMIVLCDQAESPLHNLYLDLQDNFRDQLYHSYIADVKNTERMKALFETFRPQVVFH